MPSDQIDTVRQYVGGETPSLHRLGGADFAKAKARVRSAVREIAQELVVLYQKRVQRPPATRSARTRPWQHEMEEAFPYVETPDQLQGASTTSRTTWSARSRWTAWCAATSASARPRSPSAPRSRPSRTASRWRCSSPPRCWPPSTATPSPTASPAIPIRVEVLSRFLTAKEAKKVIEGLKTGEVDCVIGTHRLLAEGVEFKDLGLLVVDEEQRFGVQAKEAMKKLKHNVDVLTLSATPIPRTLEMSLVGIRDLQPAADPAGRPPADPHLRRRVRRAGRRRGHPPRTAARGPGVLGAQPGADHRAVRRTGCASWCPRRASPSPTARWTKARSSRSCVDFWEGRFDVLVCTTIIESGIDMPTVNTLVVERADLLGLGQMHQLRGRVGRSGSRAYAYLFHPPDARLTEEAYERLRTIGEATELGSGFKIAMRDLEIRGAGNLLGESQSGHIAAVGYDLYCQMVTEAVGEMKGDAAEAAERGEARRAHRRLPAQGLRAPRRSCGSRRTAASPAVTTAAEVDDIRAEWEDRYGPVPPPAEALLDVGYLRAECHRLGLKDVSIQSNAGPPRSAAPEGERGHAPQAPRPHGDPERRHRPARRARSPAAPRRPVSSSASSASCIPPDGPATGGPNTIAESIPAPAGGRVISSRPR